MNLFTRELGSGSRTAAFVHGASESSTSWLDLAEILLGEHDLSLILVDQRGHGRSPRSSDGYTLELFAEDLIDTLPTGLDLLVGQSLGGRVAAEALPELQPKRFIGVDPGFAVPWRVGMTMRAMNRIRPLMSREAIRRAGVKRTGARTIDRQMANWDAWDSSMVPYLATTGRRNEYAPRAPVVPSALVLAENSVVVSPERARQFAELGWDVRTLAGAPHDMHVQMPQQLAQLISDLIP